MTSAAICPKGRVCGAYRHQQVPECLHPFCHQDAYRGDTFSHRGGVCVLTGHQVHADSHDFYLRVHHRNVCRNVTDRLFPSTCSRFSPLCFAIGTVVDDAIVVVEAVQAKFDEGYQSPVLAADDAMKGRVVGHSDLHPYFHGGVLPCGMMGGTSGAFYTQFGITMAVAVGISAINAFTLSPALCALLLKPSFTLTSTGTQNNFRGTLPQGVNAVFDRLSRRYVRVCMSFIAGGCCGALSRYRSGCWCFCQ